MDQAVSAIAQLMGLGDLRPGRHILRNEKRWRIGELEVTHAWHGLILPSFHDRAAVGVVAAKDTEFRDQVLPGFLRAGIAIVSEETDSLLQAVVADIDEDPLPQTVAALDLMAPNDSMCLDGVRYELNTNTSACRATLRFSNPTVPAFRYIEQAILSVVEEVAATSREKLLRSFVKTWREYLR